MRYRPANQSDNLVSIVPLHSASGSNLKASGTIGERMYCKEIQDDEQPSICSLDQSQQERMSVSGVEHRLRNVEKYEGKEGFLGNLLSRLLV